MDIVVIGIVVLVILVVALAGFLVSRGRRTTRLDDPPAPSSTGAGSGTATLEPAPVKADRDRVETVPAPTSIPDTVIVPVEVPEPSAGRMVALRSRLARSQSALGRGLLSVLSRQRLAEDDWEEIEATLLGADVGVQASTEIVDRLRTQTRVIGAASADELRALLAAELVNALDPEADRELHLSAVDGHPAVVLVVGVNGAGKTTTCAKIARVLVGDGRSVLLGAADTFRAAAAEQLTTWGERVGVRTVRGPEGSDPASVAFDAVKQGAEAGVEVVVVDTAGRLHTKAGLMDELGKVKRVLEKHGPVAETLLVLDATTGQNGVVQARVFTQVVDVSGIVLTKLDGTAKGGIVISVQRELGIPVKLIGLGEGPDDLAPFDPHMFTDALLA
ncbi:MAG: signal recognition particle-docking protein FtsY [Geodermatophilaceae bacterium]|nr:signal recognition particle-docking protein FtsY [Geodermatophilaceae bacterium]